MSGNDLLNVHDLEVTLSDGSRRRLGELAENRTLLLVFLRHFG